MALSDSTNNNRRVCAKSVLQIVLRRQCLYRHIDAFGCRVHCKRRGRRRRRFVPKPVGERPDHGAHLGADRQRFRAVLLQQSVEQDDVGGDLFDLAALGVERTLGRRNEQTEHQRGDGRDQADAQPHDVLRVLAEMMLRQRGAQQGAKHDAAERQRKNHARQNSGAHGSSPKRAAAAAREFAGRPYGQRR
jgi:hypothetical protein